MAINYIASMTVGQCRAAAAANRQAAHTWQGWLDSGLGPTGEPLPDVAIPELRRWVVEAEKIAQSWDNEAAARAARVL